MQASKLRKQVKDELESSRQKRDQKPDVTLEQLWAEAQVIMTSYTWITIEYRLSLYTLG